MEFRAPRYLLTFCLAIAAGGCHRAGESPVKAAAPAVVPAPIATASSKAESKPAKTPDLANPKETKATVAAFTPPFPERLDLFEPPKRAQSNVRRDDEHGETVELKGFINVDQPRVVLSIDGQISPVPEGGEKYGVRVISIQPPTVVLQRGRNRWTARLE